MTELSKNVAVPLSRQRRASFLELLGRFSALIFLITLVIVFSLLKSTFLTLIVGNGGPISAFDPSFNFWGQGKLFVETDNPWLQVPVPVLIFLGCAAIAYIVLRYTQYGRYIYAVGGNVEAARLSGLNTNLL